MKKMINKQEKTFTSGNTPSGNDRKRTQRINEEMINEC